MQDTLALQQLAPKHPQRDEQEQQPSQEHDPHPLPLQHLRLPGSDDPAQHGAQHIPQAPPRPPQHLHVCPILSSGEAVSLWHLDSSMTPSRLLHDSSMTPP